MSPHHFSLVLSLNFALSRPKPLSQRGYVLSYLTLSDSSQAEDAQTHLTLCFVHECLQIFKIMQIQVVRELTRMILGRMRMFTLSGMRRVS